MAKTKVEKFHPAAGQTVFGCDDGHEVTVSWGPGYPAVEVPACEHGKMARRSGDDHTATVTEDELLEAEVRAELAAEDAQRRRIDRKAAIRERLLREA